jgi:hypothetical protein
MSKSLAKLLDMPHYKLAKIIDKFESISGNGSEDIKLLVENQHLLRQKIASLGLDPEDTNDQELQQALNNKLRTDLDCIHKNLDITRHKSSAEVAAKILALAECCSGDQPVLTIKNASARRLLKNNPPKRLMKILNYRGLESMLKREDAGKLFSLLPAAESSKWNDNLAKQLKKLNRSDYETKAVKFIKIDFGDSETTRVTYVPLMGTVVLLPGKDLHKRALEAAYQMLQAEELLQADTFYLKSHLLAGDFAARTILVFSSEEPPQVKIAGHDFIKWHHLKDLFTNSVSSLERLAKTDPALEWWRQAACLGQAKDKVVSLNLGDAFKHLHYGQSAGEISFNLQESLKAGLIKRYAQYPAVKDYIQRQLDDKVIALDPASEADTLGLEMHNEFI